MTSGKEQEGQQDGLLQVDQEQKEDNRKCGPTTEWDKELGAKGHRKGQGSQCLLQFLLVRLAFSNPRSPRPVGKSGARKICCRWGSIRLEYSQNKLNTHKPMRPNGIQRQVLRELFDVTERPLSIIFERT